MDRTDADADRDPVTGLTGKDRDSIRCSWALVSEDLEAAGCGLMLRFFKEYPGNQTYFEDFRGLSEEELRVTSCLRQHALRVMRALTSIVESIDQAAVLLTVIHRTVDSHVKRGVRARQFSELMGVLARFLADSLGEQFTGDMESAWRTAATTIQAVVEARVNERLIALHNADSSS